MEKSKIEKLRSEENRIMDEFEEKTGEIKKEVRDDFPETSANLRSEYNVIASAKKKRINFVHSNGEEGVSNGKELKSGIKEENKKESALVKPEKAEPVKTEKIFVEEPIKQAALPEETENQKVGKIEKEKTFEDQKDADNITPEFPKPEPITEKLIREEPRIETESPKINQENPADMTAETPKMTFKPSEESYESRIREIRTKDDLISFLDSVPGIQEKEKFISSEEIKKTVM